LGAIFGDSYAAFRCSMFVMSWIGAAGVYAWCRTAGWARRPAFWVASVFALNPLNLTYECSFMTDTTGVTAAIWLGLLLSRFTGGSRTSGVGIGALAGVSYLARQTAVVPLISYCVLVGVQFLRKRTIPWRALVILASFAPFVLLYWLWIDTGGVPYAATWQARRGLPPFGELAERITLLLLGMALYLSPLAIGLWSGIRFRGSWKGLAIWATVLVAIVAGCGRFPAPYERQEVFDLGVGFSDSIVERQHLRGLTVEIAGEEYSVFALATTLLAAVSLLAACQLLVSAPAWLSTGANDEQQLLERWLMPLSAVVMAGLLCTVPTMHGRYVCPVCVFALLSAATRWGRLGHSTPWLGVALAASFGVFGVVGIQDNSVCQQAVWTALRDLEADGIDPLEINGGLEFGGVRRFTPRYRGETHQGPYLALLTPKQRDRHIVLFNPMNIFAPGRQYSVTYGPLPGNDVVREIPFESWLRSGRIFVLRRSGERR